MMNDRDFAVFIKKYSKHFKDFTIDIPIFDRDYEFNINLITSKHVKLRHQFSYYDLFHSKIDTVECLIRRIIDEDGRYDISSPLALSQRCRAKRNLRGITFLAPSCGYEESFKINNISQETISIEKTVDFENFSDADEGSLDDIVKIQLMSFKDLVDLKVESAELEVLEREQKRIEKEMAAGNKNTTYDEVSLMRVAMFKKQRLKWRSYFSTRIYDKPCALNIIGVGPQAIKLSKKYDFDDIYYASGGVEGEIKGLVDKVIGGSYDDYDDFKRQINRNSYDFDHELHCLIGDDVFEFDLHFSSDYVELQKYVRYENMILKFRQDRECLETFLKRYVENM
jgi:hypothetical protein